MWQKIGLTEDELVNMMYKYPAIVRKNPIGDTTLDKLSFLDLKLNLRPRETLRLCPEALGFSLERWLAPRIHASKWQGDNLPQNFAQILFEYSDRRFLREASVLMTYVEFKSWASNYFCNNIWPQILQEIREHRQKCGLEGLQDDSFGQTLCLEAESDDTQEDEQKDTGEK
eukprot:TRINITY_DN55308_c0_g1_i1.p2 TRINITY_DN55308_c0_g1~~TRINITY_DN55308_c0_g1_i1.p2  ORF type:complete len:171 (-),score=19.18 TRINITY_DN55308_c0_g1_i1:155-667(-)